MSNHIQLTITDDVGMLHVGARFNRVAGDIIRRLVELDKAVAWVHFANGGGAGPAAVPVRTVEALPPYAKDRLRAQIASRRVANSVILPTRRELDALFQSAVKHRLERVRRRVKIRCVKQG